MTDNDVAPVAKEDDVKIAEIEELKKEPRGKVSYASEKILQKMPPYLNASDFPLFLKAIIWGDFGTGKSTMSYRFGRTLVLAADPGWVVKENHSELNVEVLDYLGFRQLEALADAFYVQDRRYREFDTIVVDTIPEIQEDYVDTIVKSTTPPRASTRNVFSMKPGVDDITLPELPGFDDYHAAKNILRPSFRTLNKAPVNVIYIAHEREPNEMADKKSRDRSVRPNLTESCFKVLARQVHTIGFTEVEESDGESEYLISFRMGYKRTVAKSRIGALNGKTIPQNDFGRFIERWQGRKYVNHPPD